MLKQPHGAEKDYQIMTFIYRLSKYWYTIKFISWTQMKDLCPVTDCPESMCVVCPLQLMAIFCYEIARRISLLKNAYFSKLLWEQS